MKCAALTLFLCGLPLAHGGSLLQIADEHARPAENPFRGDARAARAGARLFARECSACHGASAQGLGRVPPLTSPLVRQVGPGTLFWILRNGSRSRRMPSFAHLPEAQRWQIIAFLQRDMPVRPAGTDE